MVPVLQLLTNFWLSKTRSIFVAVGLIWPLTCIQSPTIAYSQSIIVVDGDTLKIGDTTYRLHGIDTPEHGQKCNRAGGGTWRCGRESTSALKKLIDGKPVRCDDRGQDDYQRTIAVCHVGDLEINDTLVRRGYAWAFTTYSMDYVNVENEARARGVGIWQAPTQTAEEFRKIRWEVAEQEAPNGCPIKGNISKNGHIYHAPWSPWYTRTKVTVAKGERWFCDEAEALAAGWRAPYWGN